MNVQVDLERKKPEDVAQQFLQDKGSALSADAMIRLSGVGKTYDDGTVAVHEPRPRGRAR